MTQNVSISKFLFFLLKFRKKRLIFYSERGKPLSKRAFKIYYIATPYIAGIIIININADVTSAGPRGI